MVSLPIHEWLHFDSDGFHVDKRYRSSHGSVMGNENFFRQNVGLENCRGGGEASHSDPGKKKNTTFPRLPNTKHEEV